MHTHPETLQSDYWQLDILFVHVSLPLYFCLLRAPSYHMPLLPTSITNYITTFFKECLFSSLLSCLFPKLEAKLLRMSIYRAFSEISSSSGSLLILCLYHSVDFSGMGHCFLQIPWPNPVTWSLISHAGPGNASRNVLAPITSLVEPSAVRYTSFTNLANPSPDQPYSHPPSAV